MRSETSVRQTDSASAIAGGGSAAADADSPSTVVAAAVDAARSSGESAVVDAASLSRAAPGAAENHLTVSDQLRGARERVTPMNPENTDTSTDDPASDDDPASEHEAPPAGDAPAAERPGPAGVAERFRAMEIETHSVVIYDKENAAAWIESEVTAPIGGTLDG